MNQPGSCFRHTSEVKRATGEGARPRLAADSIPGFPRELAKRTRSSGGNGSLSEFLGERVGAKTQKKVGVNLTDVSKIRFLMAGT